MFGLEVNDHQIDSSHASVGPSTWLQCVPIHPTDFVSWTVKIMMKQKFRMCEGPGINIYK